MAVSAWDEPSWQRVDELLAQARAGSPDALGQALELCRPYLLRIANAALDARLRAKGGGSDLVQETFLESQKLFAEFHGQSVAELRAWLRAILRHRVGKFLRRYHGTDMRQVGRELANDSDAPEPAGDAETPSKYLMHAEQAERLAQALERLPEHYRQVIVWRQWDDLPFEEIARRLNRNVDAARMVWWRAVRQLQQELGDSL
jgi:RNA polymerase sigma-70 factor (ECF subfamily)